jgi:hypothetical protein
MRMGDHERQASGHLHRLAGSGHRPRHRRPAAGRIVEIYGPESSGKTTLTLSGHRRNAENGGTCAFVDAEHALDPEYARSWASTSATCWFPSPTPANRPWKSPTCWCAPAAST